MAGRKGEVQGCAILDAAIVFECRPNFNSSNLRNRGHLKPPGLLHSSQKIYTHTSALLIFQCNTLAHHMINVSFTGRHCVCVLFFFLN